MQHQDKSLNCLQVGNGKPNKDGILMTLYLLCNVNTIFEQTLHTILNKRYIHKTSFQFVDWN